MIQQDIQQLLDDILTQQQAYQQNVTQLTQVVLALKEENNRLRMLNHNLNDQVQHLLQEKRTNQENTTEASPHISGKDRIQSFYDDGIHVCHELYGKPRHSSEDCLFCQDVLLRLTQG